MGGTTDVSYYEQATLVIDIFDQQKKELVWRGMGTGVVREYSDPIDAQDALDSTVEKILSNFSSGRIQN